MSDSAVEYKADCLVYPMEDILTLKTDIGLLGFVFSDEVTSFVKSLFSLRSDPTISHEKHHSRFTKKTDLGRF